MTAGERETVVQWDDESDMARVFTCHRALAMRLLRAGFEPVKREERHGTWSFEVPKGWVSIRRPRRVVLTEEQKAEAVARGKALRARQLGRRVPEAVENSGKA